MQIKETNKNVLIVLDKDEDFSNKSILDVFRKIENYKKLPFHDVVLSMDSKYFVKFWEEFYKNKMDFKEAETKNNLFCIKF
jgi:hypothetical protein